jgi:hypothetical protein
MVTVGVFVDTGVSVEVGEGGAVWVKVTDCDIVAFCGRVADSFGLGVLGGEQEAKSRSKNKPME